jgi:Uma2 family endonuclease
MDGLLHHPWIVRRKLDVHEYHRMAAAGILHEDDRVELIEGELVAMAPIGPDHAGRANRLNRLLVLGAGREAVVAVGNPVRLDRYSEPQPDFALLRPRADDYTGAVATPADVLLLIEVAASSLRFDREVKARLYAGRGIAEYWIVDLIGGVVERYRDPGAEGYRQVDRHGPGAKLAPAALPGLVVDVGEVLG